MQQQLEPELGDLVLDDEEQFVVLLGLPLGVAAARLPRLGRALAPLYDLMQTIPSFVYLIPVAMLLGLGRAPFRFVPVLSNASSDATWSGARGLVTSQLPA